MRFEDFHMKDGHLGGHLRYRNRTILAILNLYVTLIPPIKFGLIHFTVLESSFEEFQESILDIGMK